jgi:hypothetical protein
MKGTAIAATVMTSVQTSETQIVKRVMPVIATPAISIKTPFD